MSPARAADAAAGLADLGEAWQDFRIAAFHLVEEADGRASPGARLPSVTAAARRAHAERTRAFLEELA